MLWASLDCGGTIYHSVDHCSSPDAGWEDYAWARPLGTHVAQHHHHHASGPPQLTPLTTWRILYVQLEGVGGTSELSFIAVSSMLWVQNENRWQACHSLPQGWPWQINVRASLFVGIGLVRPWASTLQGTRRGPDSWGSGEWPGQLGRVLKENTGRSGLRRGSGGWIYGSEHQIGEPLHYVMMRPKLIRMGWVLHINNLCFWYYLLSFKFIQFAVY